MSEFLKCHKYTTPRDDYFSIGIAASRGWIDLFKYLITIPGVNVKHQYNKALNWAVWKNQAKMLKFLLDNPIVERGDAFLMETDTAMIIGNTDIAEVLLSYPESRKYIEENLEEIIKQATRYNNIELVKFLENRFSLSVID
jgi:ankyrin repeat protein